MGTATYERKAPYTCHVHACDCTLVAPVYTLDSFFRRSSPTRSSRARAATLSTLPPSLSLSLSVYLSIHFPSSSAFLCLTVLVHVVRVERVRVQHTSLTTVNAPNFRKRLHFRDVYDGETVSARPDSRGTRATAKGKGPSLRRIRVLNLFQFRWSTIRSKNFQFKKNDKADIRIYSLKREK